MADRRDTKNVPDIVRKFGKTLRDRSGSLALDLLRKGQDALEDRATTARLPPPTTDGVPGTKSDVTGIDDEQPATWGGVLCFENKKSIRPWLRGEQPLLQGRTENDYPIYDPVPVPFAACFPGTVLNYVGGDLMGRLHDKVEAAALGCTRFSFLVRQARNRHPTWAWFGISTLLAPDDTPAGLCTCSGNDPERVADCTECSSAFMNVAETDTAPHPSLEHYATLWRPIKDFGFDPRIRDSRCWPEDFWLERIPPPSHAVISPPSGANWANDQPVLKKGGGSVSITLPRREKVQKGPIPAKRHVSPEPPWGGVLVFPDKALSIRQWLRGGRPFPLGAIMGDLVRGSGIVVEKFSYPPIPAATPEEFPIFADRAVIQRDDGARVIRRCSLSFLVGQMRKHDPSALWFGFSLPDDPDSTLQICGCSGGQNAIALADCAECTFGVMNIPAREQAPEPSLEHKPSLWTFAPEVDWEAHLIKASE